MQEEVVLDYRSSEGTRATHVRSTLISSSLSTLRSVNLYDALVTTLPAAYHEQILYNFAPTWLPIEIVTIYYQTWEALPMPSEAPQKLGAMVSERIMGSVLATLARGARASGLTPWLPLKQFDRLWSRVVRGGGVRIVARGPKEAAIEARGLPMLSGPRFRESYRGLIRSAGSLFSKTVYVRELPGRTSESYSVLASWV